MIASIRKFSKSFIAKVFVAIIALPFILWGMGDVFRSGNQNVIAEINDTKISTKEFMNYLQAVNITSEDIKEKGKDRIVNEVLTNYISEKIIYIETIEKGIQLTDASLKDILISDTEFQDKGKFLRTKYEKFLLTQGFAASEYEKNIFNLETKGQLLSYYSGGIKLPNFIIDDLYKRENKSKEISILDLNKIYSQKKITESEIQDFYETNKEFFRDKFLSFRYLNLSPNILEGKSEYDETFYKKIDDIENNILDGKTFEDITSPYNKNIKNIKSINIKSLLKGGKAFNVNKKLLAEVFKINNLNTPTFINFENNFYVVEILEEENSILDITNKDVRSIVDKQIKIVNLIKENTSIIKKIDDKKFDDKDMVELSKKHNVPIEINKIKNIKDNSKFNKDLVKQIYNFNAGQLFIITDYPKAEKNFLVKIEKEIDPVIDNKSEIYKEYIKKANAEYISKVYKSYDSYINSIYKIDINKKVLERLINSI